MKFRKILALFLCVTMLFCTFAEFAFAEEEVTTETDETETEVVDPLADVTQSYELMNQARLEGKAGAPRSNGNYYIIFKDRADTWEEAKAYCESFGGHLATIDSADENNFLKNMLANKGYSNAFFGLYEDQETGEWKWVTGEPLEYTNWAEGEPNNLSHTNSSTEDYGMFYYEYTDGTWNDGSFGTETNIFICEFENAVIGGYLTDTVYWKVDFKTGCLTVGGEGEMPKYTNDTLESRPWYVFGAKHAFINRVVVEDGITFVGDYAFAFMYNVNTAVIADSVTKVGTCAFDRCTKLSNVSLGNGVERLESAAFQGCTALETIDLPESLTVINWYVFYKCSALTNVVLPSKLVRIHNRAFGECTALTEMVIPKYVETMQAYVFDGCTALESVTFLSDYVSIADATTIPESTTIYGYVNSTADAYAEQYGREFVGTESVGGELGDGLTWNMDFTNRVLTVSGNGTTPDYTNDTLTDRPWDFLKKSVIKKVVIEEGIVSTGERAFKGMEKLKEAVVADSVLSLGAQTFANCWKLEKVTLGEYLSSLGGMVFYHCFALSEIELPQFLYKIEWQDFDGCKSLKEIVLPRHLVSVGRAAFTGCTALEKVIATNSWVGYNMNSNTFPETAVLYGGEGSTLQRYAEQNGRQFVVVEGTEEAHECVYTRMVIDEQYAKDETTYAFSCVCGNASETETFSTACGEDLTWSLENGELVIEGDGMMDDFALGEAPWLLSNGYVETFDDLPLGELFPKTFDEEGAIKSLDSIITTHAPWASVVEEDDNRFLYRGEVDYHRDTITLFDNEGWLNAGRFEVSFDIRPESFARNSGLLSLNRRELSDNEEMRILSVVNGLDGKNSITFGSANPFVGHVVLVDDVDVENPEWISFRVIVDPETYDYEIWVNGEKKLYTVPDEDAACGHAVWVCEDGKWDTVAFDDINKFAFSPFSNVSGAINSIYMFHFNNMKCGLDNLVVRPCADITSVTVEQGVQSIGANAFVGCENLEYVDFCDRLVSIYDSANTIPEKAEIRGYAGSTAEDYAKKYDRVFVEKEIPEDDVLAEGECGISVKWKITKDGTLIIWGDGEMFHFTLTNRAPWWSKYGQKITSVVIGEGVTNIGNYAFQGHKAIRKVSLPSSLEKIGASGFALCKALTDLDIPASVKNVGSYAFYGNTAMTDIFFRSKNTIAADNANTFAADTTVHATKGSHVHKTAEKHNRTVEDLVTTLEIGVCGDSLMWEMLSDGTLVISGEGAIPDYSQSVRAPWYKYAYKINTVILEKGITAVGAYAFQNHKQLAEVSLPSTLEKIGVSSFAVCKVLDSVSIPESVDLIGSYAFYGNTEMNDIKIHSRDTHIGGSDKTLPENTTIHAPAKAQAHKYGDKHGRNANEIVTVLDVGLCGGNVGWQMLSNGTLVIAGEGAMADYSLANRTPWYNKYSAAITSVVVADGVTGIGAFAFQNHKALENVSLASSVTEIGSSAFAICKALKTVEIPASVAVINSYAFYACSSLTDLYFDGTDVQISDSANTISSTATIHAYAGSSAEEYAKKWARAFQTKG